MGKFFHATVAAENDGITLVKIGFGEPAENPEIVPDAIEALANLGLQGGMGIHFSGPATLPVAMALAHAVAHLYGYVACFDPKLQGYVVAISHNASRRPGQLLPRG